MGRVGETHAGAHAVPDATRGMSEKMIKTWNSVDTGGCRRWEKPVFILQLVGNIKNVVLPDGYVYAH